MDLPQVLAGVYFLQVFICWEPRHAFPFHPWVCERNGSFLELSLVIHVVYLLRAFPPGAATVSSSYKQEKVFFVCLSICFFLQ